MQAEKNSNLLEKIENKARLKNNNIFMLINNYFRPNKNNFKMKMKFYKSEDFVKIIDNDMCTLRVVARNKDIMFCLEYFNDYNDSLIKTNISNLRRIIAKVAYDGDLDRIVYIRMFKDGTDTVIYQKGYCDEIHEFNEDILDLITVCINPLLNKEDNLSDLELILKDFLQ